MITLALPTAVMDTFSDVFFVFFGWLLGVLSPGLVDAINRRKQKREILGAVAIELHELRYKLAIAAHRVRTKIGKLDSKSLSLVKPIILAHKGAEEDDSFASSFKKMVEAGDENYIKTHTAWGQGQTVLRPVPYDVPFLDAHLPQLGLFPVRLQELLLRVRAELALYRDQVDWVRVCHDRTFALTGGKFEQNQGNLDSASLNLVIRAETLLWVINQLVDNEGKPIEKLHHK